MIPLSFILPYVPRSSNITTMELVNGEPQRIAASSRPEGVVCKRRRAKPVSRIGEPCPSVTTRSRAFKIAQRKNVKLGLFDLSPCCFATALSFLPFSSHIRVMMTCQKALNVMTTNEDFWKDLVFPRNGASTVDMVTLIKYIEYSNKKSVRLCLGHGAGGGKGKETYGSPFGNGVGATSSALSYDGGRFFRSLCKDGYLSNLRVLRFAEDFQWINYETLYMMLSSAAPKLQDLILVIPATVQTDALHELLDKMPSLRALEVSENKLLIPFMFFMYPSSYSYCPTVHIKIRSSIERPCM